MYELIFSQHFDREKGQDYGRLLLRKLDEKDVFNSRDVDIWVATSSHKNLQDEEDFHKRGGIIPPSYRCPELKSWIVDLKPIYLPRVKGVEGNFYRIVPYEVRTDKGGVRGDFGIHRDANVEGSLGCIVMSDKRFKSFEKRLTMLRSEGVRYVPLTVIYS